MTTDVADRAHMFTELQQTSLQQVEAAHALLSARHLKLGQVLTALEKATPIGLDQEGYLRYSPEQKATTDPVVLVGHQKEAPPTFRLNEWRSERMTPRKMLFYRDVSSKDYLEKLASFTDFNAVLHVIGNEGIFTGAYVPLAIVVPYDHNVVERSMTLAHETVHWVDRMKTSRRPLKHRNLAQERLLRSTLTEKRAYHVNAAIYETTGIDFESLTYMAMIRISINNDTIQRMYSACKSVAAEHVPQELVSQLIPCLQAVVLTSFFGNTMGCVTKKEVEAYKAAGLTS